MTPLCTFSVYLTDGRCALKKDYDNGLNSVSGFDPANVVVSCQPGPGEQYGITGMQWSFIHILHRVHAQLGYVGVS